jgi:OmpA-OmpF porin, OOP family
LSNNLLESLKEHLSGDVVSNLATLIGESPKNTGSALNAALPSLLAGLVDQSTDEKSIGKLFNLLSEGKHDGGILSNLGALSHGGEETTKLVAEGGNLLASLFGDKAGGITDLVANASGISKDSSTSLLGFITPIILGLVGRNLKIENCENAAGLAGLLSGQSAYLKGPVPAGLGNPSAGEALETAISKMAETATGTMAMASSETKVFDMDEELTVTFDDEDEEAQPPPTKNKADEIAEPASQSGSHLVEKDKEFAHSAADTFEEGAGGSKKFLPWILILAALALVWGLLKSCSVPATAPVATAPGVAVPTTPTPISAPTTPEPAKVEPPAADKPVDKANDVIEKTLPSGAVIKIPQNGFESKLVGFIESSEGINKDLWHTIDRITFDTNKASLKPESGAQINDIVEILKAYPKVKIKLAGYTDSTGVANINQKLSKDRANTVQEAIITKGIEADRIDAEGYGSEHPVADNDTEEGRQKNRRIDVQVNEK